MLFLAIFLILSCFSTEYIFAAAASKKEVSSDTASVENLEVISCLEKLFVQAHDDISEPAKKEIAVLQKFLTLSRQQQMSPDQKAPFMKKKAHVFFEKYAEYPLLLLAAMGNKAFLQTDIVSLKSLLYILTGRFLQHKPEDVEDFERIKMLYPLFSEILTTHILNQADVAASIAHLGSFNIKTSSKWTFKDISSVVKIAEKIAAREKLDENYEQLFSERVLPFIKKIVISHEAELLKIAAIGTKALVASSWCVIS